MKGRRLWWFVVREKSSKKVMDRNTGDYTLITNLMH